MNDEEPDKRQERLIAAAAAIKAAGHELSPAGERFLRESESGPKLKGFDSTAETLEGAPPSYLPDERGRSPRDQTDASG